MIRTHQDKEPVIRISNQHSEHVTRQITELLEQGAFGIEVAILIDCIDDPKVLLQGYQKPELFRNLHTLVTKIVAEDTGELTPAKAERMNVLLNTLGQYIENVSANLFSNETVQVHVGILRHGIELYKQRNFQILRPQKHNTRLRRRVGE